MTFTRCSPIRSCPMVVVVLLVLIGIIPCLAGFTSGFRRCYSGEPKSPDAVAFFLTHTWCQVDRITDAAGSKNVLLHGGELLPGNYTLCIRYVSSNYNLPSAKGCVELPLHAQAGHSYYIHYEINGSMWTPKLYEISGEDDFSRFPGDRSEIKRFKEGQTTYMKGPRTEWKQFLNGPFWQ